MRLVLEVVLSWSLLSFSHICLCKVTLAVAFCLIHVFCQNNRVDFTPCSGTASGHSSFLLRDCYCKACSCCENPLCPSVKYICDTDKEPTTDVMILCMKGFLTFLTSKMDGDLILKFLPKVTSATSDMLTWTDFHL